MEQRLNIEYEVDKTKYPGYKRTLQVLCSLDDTKPRGLVVKEVKELTLFGFEENPDLLDDMLKRPLVWAETFATLRKRLLNT